MIRDLFWRQAAEEGGGWFWIIFSKALHSTERRKRGRLRIPMTGGTPQHLHTSCLGLHLKDTPHRSMTSKRCHLLFPMTTRHQGECFSSISPLTKMKKLILSFSSLAIYPTASPSQSVSPERVSHVPSECLPAAGCSRSVRSADTASSSTGRWRCPPPGCPGGTSPPPSPHPPPAHPARACP